MGNKLFRNIERKFGKYAISNITFYLIACYAIGYVIQLLAPGIFRFLTLEPGYILRGQIWRLVTWILIPPSSDNLFFTLIMLYFYYSIGSSLEHVWGTVRLNIYLFSGMIFTILGSFVLFLILRFVTMSPFAVGFGGAFSTYYINMSLFLAYAATFPEMQVYLFFILPIKVKALGIIYGIMLIVSCIQGGVLTWVVIGSSLLNFIVFYFTSGITPRLSAGQRRQQMQYRTVVRQQHSRQGTDAREKPTGSTVITKHKCAVCGRTDVSHPSLEFRFCSKCNGNYEYCSDHLFTHEHIK